MENKHFKLSENECKTVKVINEFTNKIIESAMDRIYILFQNRKIYINKPKDFKKALNNLYFFKSFSSSTLLLNRTINSSVVL